MSKKYLNSAQTLSTAEDTQLLYNNWAASYDEEIKANGYASPMRTAEALVKSGASCEAPLLDIGCGTGVSGLYLGDAGFKDLDGSDFSVEMLALAQNKNIYTSLYKADFRDPFEFVDQSYSTITAIGVFAPGHAPPEVIDSVIDLLLDHGLFGFSLNDHTLENPEYLTEISRLVDERKVRVRWQEYGEHLPGIGLNSLVFVLERIN